LASLRGATINKALVNALHTIQSEGQPATAQDHYVAVLARVSKNASDADVSAVKSQLDKKGYTAVTIKDQIGSFKQAIDAIVMVLNAFAAIALLAASFGIVNTLLMAVQERTKEIGLMKAMGMSGRKIYLLFSLEAILLGFWGSLLGSLAGIAIGTVVNRVASNTFLKDLPGFHLTAFSVPSVAIIMLIIMAIAFIAGTLPARRASRKDPIDALRYE
jgi:putative ABC transport system permease protein